MISSHAQWCTIYGFICGLGNQVIAHTRHPQVFNHARDRIALLTVTVLDAAQYDRKESLRP